MEPMLVDQSRLSHPTEDLLEEYALGSLNESELEQVEAHLFVCQMCQEALVEIDEFVAMMKAALVEAQLKPVTVSWPRRLAAFAGDALDFFRFSRALPAYSAAMAVLAVGVVVSQTYRSSTAAPATEITLRSVRGGAGPTQARGPADASLSLKIQSPHLPGGQRFQARIVDAAGNPAWAGVPEFSIEQGYVLNVSNALGAGTYWVRLYDSQSKLLQEYGLEVR